MSSPPSNHAPLDGPSAHWLEQHGGFLRSLARGLVRGDADADELHQGAWLKVLQQATPAPNKPRGWLAKVLAHRAKELDRFAARRSWREHSVARAEAHSVDLERLDLASFLVERVRELPVGSREIVMARYFQGQELAEIAAKLGLPAETVRSRLRRALAQLREELDRRSGGDREAWCLGLGGWLLPTGSQEAAALGAATASGLGSVLSGGVFVMLVKSGVAAVIALIVVALWWQQSEPEGQLAPQDETVASVRVETEVLRRGEALVEVTGREEASTRHSVEPTGASTVAPVAAFEEHRAHGRVVLLDANGVERPFTDGALQLTFLTDQPPQHAEVIDGTFDFRWSGVAAPFLRGARLDGASRALDLEHAQRQQTLGGLDVPGCVRLVAGEHVLVFLDQGSFRLNVVDAASGVHIDEVSVIRTVGWEARVFAPDPQLEWRTLAEGVSSPVLLDASVGRESYWVRAEGFGWRHVSVNHDAVDEVTVELSPAATLVVRTTPEPGAGLPPSIEARLYPVNFEGRDPMFTRASFDAEVGARFESLSPGSYQLRVEAGQFPELAAVFAKLELELQPGELRELDLDLTGALGSQAHARVAGTLVLGPELRASELELEMRRAVGPALWPRDAWRGSVDTLRATGEPGRLAFDFEAVTPGRIKFGLYPLRQSWVIDVPAGGITDVELVVRRAAEVVVEVLDAESGERLAIEGVAWSPFPGGLFDELERPPGSLAERQLAGMEFALADPEQHTAIFQALEGTLHLGVWFEGYGEAGLEVEVQAGSTNHFSAELERKPVVELGFIDRNGTVVEGGGWGLASEDPEAEYEYLRRTSDRYVLVFEELGQWTVGSAPAGWRIISSAQLDVSSTERMEFLVTVEADEP